MAVAGIAGILSAVGSLAGVAGSFLQYSASQKAERARERQMELESQRQKREIIRQAQVARAGATAAAYNQGAQNSSALAGGLSSVTGSAGRNTEAVSQDTELGHRVFAANREASFGGFLSNLGGGISSLGGAVASNAGTITRFAEGSGFGSFFNSGPKRKNMSQFPRYAY